MKISDDHQKLYEEKYFNEDQTQSGVLVAPQTSGSKILNLWGYKKEGDVYPDFVNKEVTDIGGGLSSLAFELVSSVNEITVVDHMFAYTDKIQERIDQEEKRAEKRLEESQQKI